MKRRRLDTLALRALMKATHLLGLALAERLRQYRDQGDPAVDRFARLQEQILHVECLREALDIHGSRWDKLPERQRPHYTPKARFRILRLRTLLALSAHETARLFRVSATTVLRWEQEAHSGGEQQGTVGSLLKPVPPVRRYADAVRHLVKTMLLAGFPGDRSVAQHLARVGWRLSRRTVQRIRHEPPPALLPPPSVQPQGAVRAEYPNHVWMLDLTEIPSFFRLFSLKLAVIIDVFSRAPLAARVFCQEPSGRELAELLTHAAHRLGAPRHSVSDRGAQFTSARFRRALARHRIKHRYGAIGRTGSIAVIERFFRTLKAITGVRLRPPLLRRDLELRLALALLYYLWLRPHQGLGGSTPAELRLGTPRCHPSVPLPREAPGQEVDVGLDVEIRHLDPGFRLPYLARKIA